MPTISQLVRKGRSKKSSKSKAPALAFSFNALQNRTVRLREKQRAERIAAQSGGLGTLGLGGGYAPGEDDYPFDGNGGLEGGFDGGSSSDSDEYR